MKDYHINNRDFTHDELQAFCWQQMNIVPEWERNHLMFILEWLSNSETLDTFTSGSTGTPQKISLSRKQMLSSAQLTIDYFDLKQGTKALLALPSNFIGGKMMIVRAFVGGWHLCWAEPKSNPLLATNGEIDFAAFTPMQVGVILQTHSEKFNSIKKVLVGGSAISNNLEQQMQQCTNQVFATYGMTETITHVAVRSVNGAHPSLNFQALPGVRFSTEENHCLIIEAAHLDNEKIVTNDIVRLSSAHTFQFLGRMDNVINSGGIKFFPEEIEIKIGNLLTENYFIAKETDEALGEKMILYVESEIWDKEKKTQFISELKMQLKPFEIPKEIRFVSQFDRTESGKTLRRNY